MIATIQGVFFNTQDMHSVNKLTKHYGVNKNTLNQLARELRKPDIPEQIKTNISIDKLADSLFLTLEDRINPTPKITTLNENLSNWKRIMTDYSTLYFDTESTMTLIKQLYSDIYKDVISHLRAQPQQSDTKVSKSQIR